jgi:hypothetical protein
MSNKKGCLYNVKSFTLVEGNPFLFFFKLLWQYIIFDSLSYFGNIYSKILKKCLGK